MKYYGNTEISDVQAHPDHAGYSVLTLSDGKKVTLFDKMLASCVTEKPIDLTELRAQRCFPVVEQILKDLLEWNVHMEEIDFIVTRATMSLNESIKVANAKLWGVDERNKTMLDVHNVLTKDGAAKPIVSPYVEKEKS